jgi:hypothetical protein
MSDESEARRTRAWRRRGTGPKTGCSPSSRGSDYADSDRPDLERAATRSRHNPAVGIMKEVVER